MPNLIKKVQNFSFQEDLWKKGDKIVLGVSGGPDSMCLLDIFLKLQKKYSLDLIIVHVNYDLRGNDSQKDEALVRKVCETNQCKLVVLKPKKKFEKNLEENLRKLRYAFLEKTRKKYGFDLIAVAHNADDQIETFFLNLLRGSGEKGLAGMKTRNEQIIRPLLFCFKKEILAYAKKRKVKFRLDKTNQENDFTRNKVRNLLIPYLEKKFNPNIKKVILRTMDNFSKQENRLILELIKETKGDLQGVTTSHVKEILKILKSQKNKVQTLTFQNLKIERRGDRLTIKKEK